MRLFWRSGYEATSISDLTKAMGITPPALYGAFGDKKRLFLEAVQRYEQGPGCFGQKALTQEPTAELAIRGLLLGAVASFADPKNPRGCLVDLGRRRTVRPSSSTSLTRSPIAGARRSRRCAPELRRGKNAGELSDQADVDTLAGVVTATLYGLAVKARDGAPRARLRRIVEQVMALWPRRR